MWPIAKKEIKELAIVAFPLLVIGAILGASEFAGRYDHSPDMLEFALVAGAALGFIQGMLDRKRGRDPFLLHRPLSIGRLHGARTMAGIGLCLLVLLALFVSLWLGTWHVQSTTDRLRSQMPQNAWRLQDAFQYSFSTHLIAVALCLGAWAVLRYTLAVRHYAALVVAVLVVPGATWSVIARTEGLETALTAGLLLLLCGALTHVTLARGHPVLRRALLLLLLLLVGLEAVFWGRVHLGERQQDVYPAFGMMADGTMRWWDHGDGSQVEYDADRNVIEEWDRASMDDWPSQAVVMGRQLLWHRQGAPWNEAERPSFLSRYGRDDQHWASGLRGTLDSANRAACYGQRRTTEEIRWKDVVRWEFRDGRFLCRRRGGEREIVAGFGPDGYALGPAGAEGERFGTLLPVIGKPPSPVFLDESGQQAINLTWSWPRPGQPLPSPYEPLVVAVARVPLEIAQREARGRNVLVRSGSDLLLFDEQGGLFARETLGDDECTVTRWTAGRRPSIRVPAGQTKTCVLTAVGPFHPTRYRLRMRWLRPGHETVVGETSFEPRTVVEHLPEGILGGLVLCRPPVLNALSFVSPAPEDLGSMRGWWWRDPLLSGGSYLVCAVKAHRRARLHCRTSGAQRVWMALAFLLGPVALLTMRWTVARTTVEKVGGGKRAVDLERTPSNHVPWPAPRSTDTDVFA